MESVNTDRAAQERAERLLNTARDLFPKSRIIEVVGGGFIAVPAGTPITDACDLDDLVRKLGRHQ